MTLRQTLHRFLFALPCALVLAGCAYINPDDPPPRAPEVGDTAKAYNDDVRWGRYYEASAQLPPEQRAPFLQLLDDKTRPYRFTSVDLLQTTPSADGSDVEMLVSLEFYRLPSVSEQKVQQRQHWRWDGAQQRWFVEPDLSVLASPSVGSGGQVPAAPQR